MITKLVATRLASNKVARDLADLLTEIREERDIKEREERLRKKAPHPTNCFRPGSEGWEKAKRKQLREERKLEDRELEKEINRSLAQAKYYRKHKAKLNARRVKAMRNPDQTFKRAKQRAESRDQQWDMSFEEWWDVWQSAPPVWNREKAFFDKAWNLRGGNPKTDVQMVRIDPRKGWTKSNVRIQVPVSLQKHEV